MTANVEIPATNPYLEELTRLFTIYRRSNLNMRYYGIRAERYESRSRWIAIGSAVLSATALAILLSDAALLPRAKAAAIASAALATVLTSVAPFYRMDGEGKRASKSAFFLWPGVWTD